MAEAKMHDGKAIVAYNTQGQAVDSEGAVIKGAPKPPKDTPRDQQPGAAGAQTEAMRIAVAVALAMKDPDAVLKNAGATTETKVEPTDKTDGESADETELPTVADLPDHLAGLKSADEVRKLQSADERTTAQKHYETRLAELEGEGK